MPKLKNTLVDACVVVGVNQDIPLISSGPSGPKTYKEETKYGPYKQWVLAVITEDVAYFPESTHVVEGEPFFEESQVICPAARLPVHDEDTSNSSTNRRSVAYNPDAQRVLPFSNEVIQSLPTFCFPSGGYVYKEQQPADVTYLVLTNMEGARTYVVCMTITRPIIVWEILDEHNKLCLVNPNFAADNTPNQTSTSIVYAPLCICLVSSYPYIRTLKDCLSSMLPYIEEASDDFWRPFLKMSNILSTVPVPPPGPLAVRFQLFCNEHIIYPADEAERRVIDVDLYLPLTIFDSETIVNIVTCLLTQQRMIFVSSSYPLLTIVIETFLSYIDPIRWRLTYVPVLPNSLGDLMEAPGPFIMGVHSSLKSQVNQVKGQPETPSIITVDLDKGVIEYDEKSVIPPMPDIVSQSLLVRLRKICPHPELRLLSQPTKFTYEELKEQREEILEKVEAEIKDAFLDMLVSLFGDIFNDMSVGERFFNKTAYLDSRHKDERNFFIEVLNTDAFERFVEERLENHERRDIFAVLGERISLERKSPSRSRSFSVLQQMKRKSYIDPIFTHTKDIFDMPMHLEECLKAGRFYRNYRDNLTQQLDTLESKSIRLKAVFLYLRGFSHVACDDPINGLRDFHSLYSSAPEMYPKEFAIKLINQLNPKELDHLKSELFYKQAATFRAFNSKESIRRRNGSRRLPTHPLDKTEFEKRIKTLKICTNSRMIDWLFHILSEDSLTVSPRQFSDLYKVYTDVEKHSDNHEVAGVKINTSDRILRVSPLISSINGNGRIVLTTNMLLFVPDGGREYSLVTPICDIKEIIKYQQSSVLFWHGLQALRIINSDRNIPPFYACLKEERDIWLLFLNEMAAAHRKSIAMSDPNMVHDAANHIMIARALIEMNYSLKIVEGACLFLQNQKDLVEELSEETKEALEMRLDPCVRESKRTTVMCIAYVPGNRRLHESASVWCGMGSGAIMVYETDKWNCVSELRYAKNRVSSLLLVGNQMWAGSFDSVIYVINTETRKSEQQLQNHTDFVSDIITQYKTNPVEEKKLLVWSASYNGQLVCWNPETRENVRDITLKKVKTLSQIFFTNESNLWCVTNDKILIVDVSAKECPILQKLIVYDDFQMPVLLEYSLKVNSSKIWVSSKTKGCGIYAWDTNTLKHEWIKLPDDIQVCSMVCVDDCVWLGNKDGKVLVMPQERKVIERELHAHTDVVKSMCITREGHVITGSSSKEGKVCVWNCMMGFEMIDGKMRRVNKKVQEEIKSQYEFVNKMPTLDDHF